MPKSTYADLVESVRLAYPGQFDDDDPSALADAVLEAFPELVDQIDPVTKGLEIEARRSTDFTQDAPTTRWRPKGIPSPTGRTLPTPEPLDTITNPRARGFDGNMAVATGMRVGGAMAGTAAGAAAGAAFPPAAPWLVPGGAFVGGAAGEGAAQLFERGVGISEEISPANIALQGAINLIPAGKFAQTAATKLGGRLLPAAPTLGAAVKSLGATGAAGAGVRAGLPARMFGGAVEGAVGGTLGTASEIILEEGRPPSAEELAAAGVFGTVAGGAFTGGAELVGAVKQGRARVQVGEAGRLMAPLADGYVPASLRPAIAQPVVDIFQNVARTNPELAAGGMRRLMEVLDGQHQQDLQMQATAFLQAFGEKAPTLDDVQRFDIAKRFLDGLRTSKMEAGALNEVIRTAAGIDTMARGQGGVKLLGPAKVELGPGPGQPAPPDPGVTAALQRAPLEVAGDARMRPPPPTLAESMLGERVGRPLVPGGLDSASEAAPPMVDWTGTLDEPALAGFREGERQARLARLANATQERLPGIPAADGAPPAAPAAVKTLTRRGEAAPVPRGLEASPAVVQKLIPVEEAGMLRWMLDDANEFVFRPAEAPVQGQIDERLAQAGADAKAEFKANRASPREANGALYQLLKRMGVPGDGPRIREQIDTFLRLGKGKGQAVQGAKKLAKLFNKAWDPVRRRFNWDAIDDAEFTPLGLTRRDMQRAEFGLKLNPQFGLDEAPGVLARFAPDQLAERQALELEAAGLQRLEPTSPPEVQRFLAQQDDRALRQLRDDLIQQGEAGDEYRRWVSEALQARGVEAPPRQSPLLADEPPPPTPRIVAMEREIGDVPRGTPDQAPADTVGALDIDPTIVEDDLPLALRQTDVDAYLEARDAELQGLPNPFGDDEIGAVGDIAAVRRKRAAQAAKFRAERAPRDLQMAPKVWEQVRRVAESKPNEEIAGLIIGTPDGRVQKVVLTQNTAAATAGAFEISAQTLAAAERKARAQGLELLGSFHSQPSGSDMPSRADLRGGVADLPMMILGVRGGQVRGARVWQPKGKGSWDEGTLAIAEGAAGQGFPANPKALKQLLPKIPRFTGAVGDRPAMRRYLDTYRDELSTEPFFARAEAALDAGDHHKAWLELQTAQVLYSNIGKEAASRIPDPAVSAQVKAAFQELEFGSAQDPIGHMFALYDGRTVWSPGVGRIVVSPEIPPDLRDAGTTVGPGGIVRPPAPSVALPSEAARQRMTVDVVNKILGDAKASEVLKDPSGNTATRLFRQIGEQVMLSPARFKAAKALGIPPEQISAHFEADISNAGRMLAALSTWSRQNNEAIRRIDGIYGADAGIEDLVIQGRGRTIGRLSQLSKANTYDLLVKPGQSWDKTMLMFDLMKAGKAGKFDQFDRASHGFMLSQVSTAMRNLHSATVRWGSAVTDSVWEGLGWTMRMKPTQALNAYKRAGDLLAHVPLLRPDGWVLPWQARRAELEGIFDFGHGFLQLSGEQRQSVVRLLSDQPEIAQHFLGGTMFGELDQRGKTGWKIIDTLNSPKLQRTLTMFNRAQEYTVRMQMLEVSLRDQLRKAGFDPGVLKLPSAALQDLVGADRWRYMLDRSVGESLDFTFSGGLVRKGMGRDDMGRTQPAANTYIIDLVNKLPLLRSGYPFPRFNLAAAPRYLWDHSGLSMFIEPLYAKVAKRGRYALGKRAANYRDVLIPEIQQKISSTQVQHGEALIAWQALKREAGTRKGMETRWRKRFGDVDKTLPGMLDARKANLEKIQQLEGAISVAGRRFYDLDANLKDLRSQVKPLQEIVQTAGQVSAPENFTELFARSATGMMLMTGAMAMRADQREKGTPWYKYKLEGSDTQWDLRPLAPFVQYLFVADVVQDIYDNTDWARVDADLRANTYTWETISDGLFSGGRYEGQYAADDVAKALLLVLPGVAEALVSGGDASIYDYYEGKYTLQSLGRQIAMAGASVSQISGTTLALVEAITGIGSDGLPLPSKQGNLAVEVIGQELARFTIPFAQFKSVTDLYSDEESYARIADGQGAAPMAQLLGNLPFVGAAVIPETYNQLTGQPLDTHLPLMRSALGITLQKWNRVQGEIIDTGIAGPSVYIKSTNDEFLDRLIATHYSGLVQQWLPTLLDSAEYRKLDTAALRRDALSKAFSDLKKAAIGYAAMDAGVTEVRLAREGTEGRRRRLRGERLQQLLLEEQLLETTPGEVAEPDIAEPQPNDTPEPEPDDDVPQ